MRDKKIRVGLIGAGGWAKYGHIPALQSLEEFEIVAVSSRKQERAEEYAATFNILHAFGDEQGLITHPDVELVVILAPGPEHARLSRAAIAAGKDVYSEWPLSTKTSDSEDLLSLAEAKGVRHIVGLQRHFLDLLFQSVGFPKKLTAVVENQFPLITIEETGQKIPTTRPDEAMVIGAAYARDRKKGTSEASNFSDALRQHQLIDQIVQASETFFK